MKDNLLKFSIIVPIYNVEKYLCICVDSILMQTYTNFELILVDDGSPDNCGLICDEYVQKDSRVKVIHKSNGGLVSARKAGAKIATGDYVVCVDSDDWISKDHLLKISEVIHKENPEIVCFSYYETDAQSETRKKIPYREGMYTKNQTQKEIVFHRQYGQKHIAWNYIKKNNWRLMTK
jgi:glycosyltransferase involved in cell wall biosynthesis